MFIFLIILALLFGIPLFVALLLIFLPVRVGLSGHYREDGAAAQGWVRPFAGAMGVVFDVVGDGIALRLVLGPWTVRRMMKKHPVPEENAPPGDKSPDADGWSESGAVPRRMEPDAPVAPRTAAEDLKRGGDAAMPVASAPDAPRRDAGAAPDAPQREPDRARPGLFARLRALKVQIDRYRSYWTEVQPVLGRFFWRLLRSAKFQNLEVEVAFGTGDPALTGQIFGYVQAIRPLLGRHLHLWVTPDFMEMRLEGAGRLTGSIYLHRTLWSMACLAVRGGWIGFWIWRAERRAQRASALREV